MMAPATWEPAAEKIALDKFVAMAHNNTNLMRFVMIAVSVFERKGTGKLLLDIKSGEAKGGESNFKF